MTLNVCASKVELCSNHIAFTFGVADKADSKVITLPTIPVHF